MFPAVLLRYSESVSVWRRLRLIGLISLCVVLSALGGIGVALGLLQSPTG
jgi:hypothetical protein